MVTNAPIILKPEKKSARQKALEKHPVLTRVLEAGAVVEAGILAGLLGKPQATIGALKSVPSILGKTATKIIPTTPKGVLTAAVTVPTAVGVLSSSKKARETAKNVLNPAENVKRGKKIGEIIEGGTSKAADVLGIAEGSSVKEAITKGVKAAGLVGGVVGAGIVGKKVLEKAKDKITQSKEEKAAEVSKLPDSMKEFGFTEPQQVGVGGIPIPTTPAYSSASQPLQSQNPQQPINNIIQIAIK